MLINAHKNIDGTYDLEPASYDLRAGIIIWKETNIKSGSSHPISKSYNQNLPLTQQEKVTLQPGQVMFVITYEEVKMPLELCGTVYAKNKFSREGILALTTGHIDPGIQCPIVIRLINLRSIPFTFHLGDPIYTVVFHTLEVGDKNALVSHKPISMHETYKRTIDSANSALGNALNDLSLTREFIRKDEFLNDLSLTRDFIRKDEFLSNHSLTGEFIRKEDFSKLFIRQFITTVWGWLIIVFTLLAAFASTLKIIDFYKPK